MTEIAIMGEDVIKEIIKTQKQILSAMEQLIPNKQQWVTIKEAAQIANLSEQTIRKLFETNSIVGKRIGKKSIRIDRTSL
ncbi:MAG: hypothetical protein COA44_04605 [Arcobacter sp.]|nr:MAG: hypothetical protein COA44_04605 [Arcobacter sp.]